MKMSNLPIFLINFLLTTYLDPFFRALETGFRPELSDDQIFFYLQIK